MKQNTFNLRFDTDNQLECTMSYRAATTNKTSFHKWFEMFFHDTGENEPARKIKKYMQTGLIGLILNVMISTFHYWYLSLFIGKEDDDGLFICWELLK